MAVPTADVDDFRLGGKEELQVDREAGSPAQENAVEIAQAINPKARTVYVDSDPMAARHGRALLAKDERTKTVQLDLRPPEAIVSRASDAGGGNSAFPQKTMRIPGRSCCGGLAAIVGSDVDLGLAEQDAELVDSLGGVGRKE
ncbi:SAM-dependent methyltransferase [Nonomuraea sp. NPDC050153]|uniref:SAM-dependent methyltransferase n=1 Tax=Nonomuraea sp. NPDC050153 TaxID=3364359 RepID=UPI0037941D9A